MSKKTILTLTSTFPRWKKDRDPPFVFELCQRLQSRYRIRVLAPHTKGAAPRESLDGMEVHRYRYFPEKWQRLAYDGGIMATIRGTPLSALQIPFFLTAQFVATVRQLRKAPCDVIHAHWLIPQGFIAVVARCFAPKPPPILCTVHGGDLYSLRGRLFSCLKRFVVRNCDHVTVVGRSMLVPLLSLGARRKRLTVIPMGTDLTSSFIPGDAPAVRSRILFVGRLVEIKGVRFLIEAFPAIRKHCPETVLDIVGSGPLLPELKRQAAKLESCDHIRFHGAVAKEFLPEWYQQAEVVVFPSIDQEGFGLVLVEAMGCGCAVVATDLEAIRDIVRNDETGIVVPAGSANGLAEAIRTLLKNARKRMELGKRGREFVLSRFDWDSIAERYSNVIADLIRRQSVQKDHDRQKPSFPD